MSAPLTAFLTLRDEMVAARTGTGGGDVCRALTSALDGALAAVAAELTGGRLAVVAVGGYGRGEMCLYSDVDIMLLHGGRLPEHAVERLLYPLWDARLKVGHAVRSVKEATAAARERPETLTALLDARLVAGDAELVGEMTTALRALLRRDPATLTRFLAESEHARRTQEPYQLMEAGLKEGRGGLRTLHGLHWRRRAAAIVSGSSEGEGPHATAEGEIRDVLLSTRNALHAVSGRPFDVYAFDLRVDVARWLGRDPDDVSHRLYAAMRSADALSRTQAEEPVEPAGLRLPFRARRATPRAVEPSVRSNQPLTLAVAALAVGGDAPPFSDAEESAIREAPPPQPDAATRTALLHILRSGRPGQAIWDRLVRLGWATRAIPEWEHTVAAPQHVAFHLHPLDVHLWRTVIELGAIVRPDGGEPWCAEVADTFGALDDTLLAAFLHDVGKGMEGDHSATGARVAASLMRRLGFGPATIATVTSAIRHHLLLPTVATRRDIDDATVIASVADQAGDARTLALLLLLTVADSRATGPSVWTPWKASLVRTLYTRVAAELARRSGLTEHSPIEDRLRAELTVATTGRFEPAMVEQHLAAMPPGYLTAFGVADLVRHLESVSPPPESDAVIVTVRRDSPADNVLVVAQDRPGLLATMSGVFALHNVSVLDGRFFTRADGVALDNFHVQDALDGSVEARRWERVREDMARAVRGELPLESMLRDKARAYDRETGPSAVEVVIDNDAAPGSTLVEVHCTDRIGILHRVTRAIFEQGLDIRLAKIDTMGRQVVDTFYVRDVNGNPLRDPVQLESLRAAVVSGLAE